VSERPWWDSAALASSRRPSRWFHLAVAALVLVTLWWGSVPRSYSFWIWLSPWDVVWSPAPLWMAIAMYWVVRVLAVAPRGRDARAWYAAPTLAALTWVSVFCEIPLQMRFRASQASLQSDAEQWVDEPNDSKRKSEALWLGLYRVRRHVHDGAVYYKVPGAGYLMEWGGFVYSPSRRPPELIRDLGGGWYVWLHST